MYSELHQLLAETCRTPCGWTSAYLPVLSDPTFSLARFTLGILVSRFAKQVGVLLVVFPLPGTFYPSLLFTRYLPWGLWIAGGGLGVEAS